MQGRCVRRARPRCKNLSRARECLWSQIYCIFPDSSFLQWWGTFPTWRFKRGKSPKNCSKAGLGVFWEKVSLSLWPTTLFTFLSFFFFFYMYVGKGAFSMYEVNLMKGVVAMSGIEGRGGKRRGAVTNGVSLSGGQAGAWGTPLVRLCRGGTGAKMLKERERGRVPQRERMCEVSLPPLPV